MNLNRQISVTLIIMYAFIAVVPYTGQLKLCIDDCHIAIESADKKCGEVADMHDEGHYHSEKGIVAVNDDDCTDYMLPAPAETHIANPLQREIAGNSNLYSPLPEFIITAWNDVKVANNRLIPLPYSPWSPPKNQIAVYRL